MDEFIASAAWSLLGFVIGWLVGREARTIETIKEAVVDERPEEKTVSGGARMPEVVVVRQEQSPHFPEPTSDGSRTLGWIVIVLALFTILQAAYFTFENQQNVECQAKYNAAVAEVQNRRGEWIDEDRAVLIDFFKTVYNKPADDEEELQAFRNLIRTYDRNSALRAENPLPSLPGGCFP